MIHFYIAALPNDTVLNHATTFFLRPVHYFWGQRTVSNSKLIYETTSVAKTALMFALFIPSLIAGTALRLLSFSSEEVRASFRNLSNLPSSSRPSQPSNLFGTPSSKTK